MKDRRRIGDPFHRPRFNDMLLPRFLCDHVKTGADLAVQVKYDNEVVGLCGACYQNYDSVKLTMDGKVVIVK